MDDHRQFFDYAEIIASAVQAPLIEDMVPIEHAVSMPVPTMRWSSPAFAVFAGPALRRPDKPLELHPPDRWWVVDAESGDVVLYGLTQHVPFAAAPIDESVIVEPSDRSIDDADEDRLVLGELMDAMAPAFFAGGVNDTTGRQDLARAIDRCVHRGVEAWYRALAPDFFTWLDPENEQAGERDE